jgi:ADP-ribosylglycohydrolase
MGVGITVNAVTKHAQFLTDPVSAARHVFTHSGSTSAANGDVMRTSIMGVWEFHDIDRVIANSTLIASVTHTHPKCIASSVLVSVIIAWILQGEACMSIEECEVLLARAEKLVLPKLPEADRKEFSACLHHSALSELKLDDARSMGYTLKCVGSGVFGLRCAIDDGPKAFHRMMDRIAREGGDADTYVCALSHVLEFMLFGSN